MKLLARAPTDRDAALVRAALRVAATAKANGLAYGKLRPGQCRYFLAGEPGPRATCCGLPVAGAGKLGDSYCAEHRGRLVLAVAAGRARAPA